MRVVLFTAPWCGPCKPVARVLEELAREHPRVAFEVVDVEAEPQGDVLALPTVVGYRGEVVVRRLEGPRRRPEYERLVAEVVEAGERSEP